MPPAARLLSQRSHGGQLTVPNYAFVCTLLNFLSVSCDSSLYRPSSTTSGGSFGHGCGLSAVGLA